VDVDNLRTFQIGVSLEPVVQKLYDSELSYSFFQKVAKEQHDYVSNFLGKLLAMDWIVPVVRKRTNRASGRNGQSELRRGGEKAEHFGPLKEAVPN
jgi:hypothetical protein